MEVYLRPLRLFSRFWRRPIGIASMKSASPAALKEEANVELVHKFNKDIQAGGVVPVFRRALLFPSRVALQDDFGIYTYAGLHQAASALSKDIAAQLVGDSERTIAYMCSNDASHIIVQWAIWMTGNIAVPLTPLHPPDMLKYFMTDSMASLVVCTQEYENLLRPITLDVSLPLLTTTRDNEITAQLYQPNSTFLTTKTEDSLPDIGKTNDWYGSREAMLIYTSGTTSKPKGVVWTHSMLQTQISSLHSAWRYSARDVVLHALPLHHIHGQLNSMLASLAAGARIRMLSKFVSHVVWSRLLGMGERDEFKVTVFHGVPAMYAKLAHDYDKMFGDLRTAEYVRSTLANRMRLMCAGSAPLPETLFKKWEDLSGIRLLERYGMTECGMAISNPFDPVEERTVGCVGFPLPGMQARIAVATEGSEEMQPLVTVETPAVSNEISLDRLFASTKDFPSLEDGDWQEPIITKHKPNIEGVYQGELLLKGPGVFSRYWNRAPTLASSDWTSDEWFRSGDTASYSDTFRILGRTSSDIIKTSGYKVSALQVESAILEHPDVTDAAVVGIPHEDYGEIVAVVVTTRDKKTLSIQELKNEAGKKLAPYQLPKTMVVVEEMPRNIMGKLDKKVIKAKFAEALALK